MQTQENVAAAAAAAACDRSSSPSCPNLLQARLSGGRVFLTKLQTLQHDTAEIHISNVIVGYRGDTYVPPSSHSHVIRHKLFGRCCFICSFIF